MTDPKRLLDDGANADLTKLLSAAKSEVPDAAQLGALATKIGLLGSAGAAGIGAGGAGAGGASAGGGGAGAVGVTAGKTGLLLKIGGAAVMATAAAAATAVVTNTREDGPRAPVGIVATVAPSVAPLGRQPLVAPEMSAPPATTARASAAPSHKTIPSADSGPEAEVRLLERAQDALRSRPAEALALADDHGRRFPTGMLVQEREVIAIEALMKLERTGEARARAQRFKTRFPGSSHTRRIATLVGE